MSMRSELRRLRRDAQGRIGELLDQIETVERRRDRAIRAVRRRWDAQDVSKRGIRLIADFEGFRSRAYQDVAGHWTIGFGHTGSAAARPGNVITRAEAYELLAEDVAEAAQAARNYVDVRLNRNRFDALVSFIFNVGVGAFHGSTLRRELNTACYSCVPKQLRLWVYAGGVKYQGLANRREAEVALWQKGV